MEGAMKYFDSLGSYDRLKEAGVAEEQARAIIKTVNEIALGHDQNLATKQDINDLAVATKQDINNLAVATKQDISDLAASTKQDINDLAASTKQDINALAISTKKDISDLAATTQADIGRLEKKMDEKFIDVNLNLTEIKANMYWMQKVFFGSILLILVNIAISLFQHLPYTH